MKIIHVFWPEKVLKITYQELVVERKEDLDFWVLSTFLPTFLISRLLVYVEPALFINVRGAHVHHLTYGIIILALSGYLGLIVKSWHWKVFLAAFYGVGLALAFDEFGMWLRLKDDYWVRQSYDAVLVIFAWLINAVYFQAFWMRFFKRLFAEEGVDA